MLENQKRKKPLDGLTVHVLDLLAPWQEVNAKRMFGGIGLFADGTMFAIIIDEILYLKESFDDDGNPVKAKFKKQYFEYDRKGSIARLYYYQVPEKALDDSRYMIELATESLRSARSRPPKKKKKIATPKL